MNPKFGSQKCIGLLDSIVEYYFCHVSMSGYCSVYRSNSIFRSDPYFSLASLYNVKYSVMLWSDNRNILDYWIFIARYCFKYDF